MPLPDLSVILTHENADFDAISALLGTHKLYPEAIPVLPRHVNRNIRHFLSLYGVDLPMVAVEDVTRGRVHTWAEKMEIKWAYLDPKSLDKEGQAEPKSVHMTASENIRLEWID